MLLVGLAALVIRGAARTSQARAHRQQMVTLARDTTMVSAGQVQGTVRRELVLRGEGQGTAPDELRRMVRNLALGTYVNDILVAQDRALYRWPERLTEALRVYIEPSSPIQNWDAQYPEKARSVFAEWSEAGFPLRFTFIMDSASADITIRWRDRFPPEDGQRIGLTDRVQTSAFLITAARVSVANHDSAGRALSVSTIDGILRHEIGHALGLNHSRDATSVMYRESATATIGNSDRATLRLLYLVPGGSLK